MIERQLSILANLDQVPIRITHVAAPFPAIIFQRFGKKDCAFVAPLFVAGPDVRDAQVEEATYGIVIRRCSEEDLWLVGSWLAAGIENNPGISLRCLDFLSQS